MWTCPRCRRRFANRNQSHSCGRHDLAHHFRSKDRSIRLTSPAEIDAEFRAWMREAYAVGKQEHLRS